MMVNSFYKKFLAFVLCGGLVGSMMAEGPSLSSTAAEFISTQVKTVNNALAFGLAQSTIKFVTACALLGIGWELWGAFFDSKQGDSNKWRRLVARIVLAGVAGYALIEWKSPQVVRFCKFIGDSQAVGPYNAEIAIPVPVK